VNNIANVIGATTMSSIYRNLEQPHAAPTSHSDHRMVDQRPGLPPLNIHGMTEEEQGTSAEAIAKWLALLEATPSIDISDEEWVRMNKIREEDRAWQKIHNEKRDAILQRQPE